ncbi:EamA family transporter [Candidatus Woesearchaeota archaeon]|nr:EamA family transporter [Candidatus Woesearchaeota archaeon]
MSWILFSLLAALTWAVVDTVDKHILTKWVKKPVVLLIVIGILGFIAAFFIYMFKGYEYLSIVNILLAFLAGIFYIIATLFYFKAAKIEEISRVVPLFHLTHLFVLVLAAVFLGEIFTPIRYLGIFLLIFGAVLISLKKFAISIGKAFWLMVLCSSCLALNAIISKYLLNLANFWTVFSYTRIGTIFVIGPLLYLNFNEFLHLSRKGPKVLSIVTLNEASNLLGVFFITIAASIGFVTLVQALSAVQPFFVLLFAVLLSVFYPKFLKEKMSKSIIIVKFLATVIMFIGAILVV